MKGPWAVGVDVGATKIEAARVNLGGMVGDSIRTATNVSGGPKAIIADILEAVRTLTERAGSDPAGVGAGIAGQIDRDTGSVQFAPNLGWRDVPLRADLEEALGIDTVVTNDVRAATFGEWLHGAGRGYNDIVCVYVGTGIGGGVVAAGRMLSGCTNTAGEIGHITIDLNGPPCTCGNRGCLEALAGGWALARAARLMIEEDPKGGRTLLEMAGGITADVSAETIARAAKKGDAMALRLLEDAGRALAAGCVSLVNAFNPCRLILGGGVVDGVPELIDRVRRGLDQRALPAARAGVEVVPAVLGPIAGVVGAGSLALHIRSDQGQA